MESAFGVEGELLRAGQVGDRGEVAGDDASGYNSPAGGRDYGEAEGDGARGTGRSGRKRTRPLQGTPRRPSKGAAAAGDVDPAGQSGDRSSEDRSASWPRGDARPHLRGKSDLATDEALETAEAVAVSRGLGEPPAADAARIPRRSASRRGAQRTEAAPAENWSVAAKSGSSTINAVWKAAERQQFVARGGVASVITTAASAKSSASFNPEEALDVSEDAILALFGQNIEQWAWMFARWAIADASDMCKDSEFTQILRLTLSQSRSKNFSVP
jgi:hypothetical protein